ncbi:MAG TPA: TIGR02444 family protein [Stellaceae bacterium]|nr:TIGR02444 family protein [Stellaceae bacterium]
MADAFEDFWSFALRLYARPAVAPACLALQDAHGLDVIIALYCCWLGASGRGRLDAAGLAAAEATARPWRGAVVEPLRRARHALKGVAGAEALYGRMKQIELDAERIAFARLAPLAPPPDDAATGRAEAARDNLLLYAGAASDAAAPIIAAVAAMAR